MPTIRDANLLHGTTTFADARLAIEALRCWVQEAEAMGWKREQLAATLNIGDHQATALLGTRGFVAGLLEGHGEKEREVRRGIREGFPADAYVLVGHEVRRAAPCAAYEERLVGRALAEVDTIVAQLAWASGG